MPTKITRDQYNRRLDELCDRYRDGATPALALARELNESLAAFKRGVVIVETTAPTRPAPRPAASKPAKSSKRDRRIAAIVRETLTAVSAPKPAPSTTGVATPKPTATAPAKPLDAMNADELAAATVSGVGGSSPFWRPRETAPAATVLESVADAEQTARDLASLSSEGLAKVYDATARRAGHRSPLWVA